MKLFLIRHGEAVEGQIDDRRPLSATGRQQVWAAAEFYRRSAAGIIVFWHSTKLRAQQTAEIFCDVVRPQAALIEKPYLAPHSPVDDILKDIAGAHGDSAVVGHMPFMSRLLSRLVLVGGAGPQPRFPVAGTQVLSRDSQGIWKWLGPDPDGVAG